MNQSLVSRAKELILRNTYFAQAEDAKPFAKQVEVFQDAASIVCRYVVAANQVGKTSIGAREIAWLFQDYHPYVDVQERLGPGPKTLMVVGQNIKMMTTELWENKIEPLLVPGSYRVERPQGVLSRVINKQNGNRILFISHDNATTARKNVQGYVAQYVWIDEMPSDVSLLDELRLRIVNSNGMFLATFTPLIVSDEIRESIDTAEPPYGKKYQFSMFDNPKHKGREEELIKEYRGDRTRLYGEWKRREQTVYAPAVLPLPPYYDPHLWRHVEAVDPAISSKAGYLLLAQDPETMVWWVVKEAYIKTRTMGGLIKECLLLGAGHNIVTRVSDPAAPAFTNEASDSFKLNYQTVPYKNKRKQALIIKPQTMMEQGRLVISDKQTMLLKEMTGAEWADNQQGGIRHSRRFHLIDCLQYAVDVLPKDEAPVRRLTRDEYLNKLWERQNDRARQAKLGRVARINRLWGRKWWPF